VRGLAACLVLACVGTTLTLLSGCTGSAYTILARDIVYCPYGHRDLVDVPIRYGLLRPETFKTSREEDRIRWVSGGCLVAPWNPRTAVTCRTCNFLYHQPDPDIGESVESLQSLSADVQAAYLAEYDFAGWWSRDSSDLASFEDPFPAVLLTFPTPAEEDLIGKVSYGQSLDGDGPPTAASLSYRTKASFEQVRDRIHEWYAQHELVPADWTWPPASEGNTRQFHWRVYWPDVTISLSHNAEREMSWVRVSQRYDKQR